jgi:hypothetical protein
VAAVKRQEQRRGPGGRGVRRFGSVREHMLSRISLSAVALLTTFAAGVVGAAAQDSRYPDMRGQWERNFIPRWAPGNEKAPLTPEYQKVFDANLADMANGGPGNVPSWYCLPQGMPMMMNAYDPMELIITPDITYILVSHVNDSYRRIYTDGRPWPAEPTPIFSGYSIGRWIDEDGDGKYDALEIETRFLKLPRSYDIAGIPFHEDGQTVIKERIYLDKKDPNLLYDEITVIDNALTRPYVKLQKATRNPSPHPVWFSDVCSESNTHVRIENENYFRSADGKLMPSKKNQSPPDLTYVGKKL